MARKDAVVKLTMMAVKVAGRVLATGATSWVGAGFLCLVPCAVFLFRRRGNRRMPGRSKQWNRGITPMACVRKQGRLASTEP